MKHAIVDAAPMGKSRLAKLIFTALMCVALVLCAGCGMLGGSSVSSTSGDADEKLEVSDTLVSSSSASTATSSASTVSSSTSASSAAGNASLAQQLEDDITQVADSSGMDVGVSVIDLTSGVEAGYEANESMAAASMIKLIVAETFLKQVAAGKYSLDETYTLQGSDIVGGTGSMQGLGAGATVTYGDAVTRMISESDNVATNVIINAVGMDAVNAEADRLGLSATKLNRLMMDSEAMAAGIENYTSAEDIALLLKMVYEGTFVNADMSAFMLNALEQQVETGGISLGLPDGVTFAHKTGTLSIARHDGGIVEGDHPYVVVVLCGGAGFNEQGALNTMSQIGAVTYSDIAA